LTRGQQSPAAFEHAGRVVVTTGRQCPAAPDAPGDARPSRPSADHDDIGAPVSDPCQSVIAASTSPELTRIRFVRSEASFSLSALPYSGSPRVDGHPTVARRPAGGAGPFGASGSEATSRSAFPASHRCSMPASRAGPAPAVWVRARAPRNGCVVARGFVSPPAAKRRRCRRLPHHLASTVIRSRGIPQFGSFPSWVCRSPTLAARCSPVGDAPLWDPIGNDRLFRCHAPSQHHADISVNVAERRARRSPDEREEAEDRARILLAVGVVRSRIHFFAL